MLGAGPLLAVVGATASGKSALALTLAEGLGGEIVSLDSMQVYRHLDIGTAKPSAAERARVPHHLLDIVEPDQPFSAGAYRRAAVEALAAIRGRGRVPILCGGTGLYLQALLGGLAEIPPVPGDVCARVQALLERLGPAECHRELARRDPVAAARIHPHDPARIGRALEVHLATNRPLSAFQRQQLFAPPPPELLLLEVRWPRAELYGRIDRRVEAMLAAGWVAEVNRVLALGFSPRLKPLRAIGYREIVEYVEGRRGADTLAGTIAGRTRHYAKRQGTWFRRQPGIRWVEPGDARALFALAEKHLKIG
ncbi:MAG: tRNA (adenosine(37)-N6)-dimethylallyltransferase MiaA [Candidatus Lambdaproteobacteria bacterium]|nr:tRNA (adenosine(37)-N6)-dimethylallyltransferase MiaA [Candidatus Lambdaproteobacteria bacterium]